MEIPYTPPHYVPEEIREQLLGTIPAFVEVSENMESLAKVPELTNYTRATYIGFGYKAVMLLASMLGRERLFCVIHDAVCAGYLLGYKKGKAMAILAPEEK